MVGGHRSNKGNKAQWVRVWTLETDNLDLF